MKAIFPAFLLFASPANADQQLRAPVVDANDDFGSAMATDGDTLVIGAPKEDGGSASDQADNSLTDSGAAYVFVRVAGQWVFQGYLKAPNRDFEFYFGSSVAISGDTIIVGSPTYGNSAGSFFVDPSGAAYIFTRENGVWNQQQMLAGSNTGGSDNFGHSVAIDGDTVVVGARFEAGAGDALLDSGAAYVFSRSNGTWAENRYLKASNASALDEFGTSVAISGTIVAVGAPFEDDGGAEAGAVYVFEKGTQGWAEQQILRASDAATGDFFGTSLAMGNGLVIGARGEDDIENGSGAAYVFQKNGGRWTQETRLKAATPSATAEFGKSVSSDGERIVCGAPGQDTAGNNAGGAWSFHRSTSGWGLASAISATNPGAGDGYGAAVSISGMQIFASSPGENGATDTSSNSGAAYAFMLSPNSFSEWISYQGYSGNAALETATPAGNGIPNLLAYSLKIPVGSGGGGRLPALAPNGSFFMRPISPPEDVRFIWQESDDLVHWDDLASRESGGVWTGDFAANVSEGIPLDGFIEVMVSYSRNSPKLFTRLKVVQK